MSLGIVILFILSLVCLIMSFCHFREKGIVLNNEYICVSKQEREYMTIEHNRPHFRQSAIVFFLLGITFIAFALGDFLKLNWIIFIAYLLIIVNIIYAVVSSITIAKKQGKL